MNSPVLKSVYACQNVARRSVAHHTYLNIANPEHGIGGFDGLLNTFVSASASVQATKVWHRFINATLTHIGIEGWESSQSGELLTLVLEVVADGESIDDDDRILALLHHLAKLSHDVFLELRIVRAQSSWQGRLECRCITLQV